MEEDDLLKGWKKTQPKKIHTFKPVALPYFQNGADTSRCMRVAADSAGGGES